MKKTLLLIVPVFAVVLFFGNAAGVNAESSEYPLYYSSENSFENSNNNLYVYDSQERSAAAFGALKHYAWTATGKIINLLDPVTERKEGQAVFSLASINSLSLKEGAKGHGGFGGEKIIGAFGSLHPVAGHPWVFVMTLTFGTILLSLWFLRLSTGVSPPSPAEALREGELRLFRF